MNFADTLPDDAEPQHDVVYRPRAPELKARLRRRVHVWLVVLAAALLGLLRTLLMPMPLLAAQSDDFHTIATKAGWEIMGFVGIAMLAAFASIVNADAVDRLTELGTWRGGGRQ